jgi:hypothetical protein
MAVCIYVALEGLKRDPTFYKKSIVKSRGPLNKCNTHINERGSGRYLSSKTTRSANAVNVEFSVVWKVIVYNKRNLPNL